jgi:hypothetical protein
MSCCGGHHSNKDNHSQNLSIKSKFWTLLIGIGVIAALIYLLN